MLVWRISAARHAARAFTGEGALKYAARWHRQGTALVYTSATLALAALEMFANLEPNDISTRLVAISAQIPPAVKILELDMGALPRDWREHPAPPSLRELGSGWVRDSQSAVLAVPSAIIPSERNYLLNPAHPDFRKLVILPPAAFSFDPRMWKRGTAPARKSAPTSAGVRNYSSPASAA
jgi:RES domain-containing protein